MPEPHKSPTLLIVVNTDFFFLSHRLPLALAARDRGWRVVVATADTGRADEIRAKGLEYHSLGMTRSDTGLVREARSVLELVRLLRRTKPDVVHLVATKAVLYGGLAALVLPRAGVVYAVTGAGYIFAVSHFPILQRLASFAYAVVLRRRRSVTIFQNVEDRALFVDRRIVRDKQAVLIRGSGVDVESWPVYPEPAEPVVLLASRLFAEKGVHTFVESARLIRQELPGTRCVLAGALDAGLPSAISPEEVRSWVDEGVVEYWGHRNDMPEVLGQCTVFVLPTYHREGVPRVLLEAGAARRPSVTTDIPGCRDAVLDGQTGVLVPPHEPKMVAAAVVHLLNDDSHREKLGCAARDRIAQYFGLPHVIESTLAIYEGLASGASGGGD